MSSVSVAARILRTIIMQASSLGRTLLPRRLVTRALIAALRLMPAASLLDFLSELLEPSSSRWAIENIDMVARFLGALYVVTLGVLIWSLTRRTIPRDDGQKKVAEEQAKAIADLQKELETERKRRRDLEGELEKIRVQIEEQRQRYEKQVDDLLARGRATTREAADAATKAQEDLKNAKETQKAVEAAKATTQLAEEVSVLTATVEETKGALAEVRNETVAERVKVKKAAEDRERLEKELAKEKERATKLEGQCDRAQKEIDSLNQQMIKSHASNASTDTLAANSTFLEDLEKSLEADDNDERTPKSIVEDDEEFTVDDAVSAHAALEALERALGGDISEEEDPNFVPPPPVPLPHSSSVPGIILTNEKKDKKRVLSRRVSFGGGSEEAEAAAAVAAAVAAGTTETGNDEIEAISDAGNAVSLLKGYGAKADINKAGQRARGRRGGGTKEMEDEHLCAFPFIDEQRSLFCIFDGHAGKECATDAKKFFPLELASALQNHLMDKDVGTILRAAFLSTDEKLKHHEYMGCTATAVYIWAVSAERFLQCGNVGDSTAFLCRNGTATPLSFDHKVTSQAEKERVRAMGIEVSDTQGRLSGLAISRALGDHFTKVERTGIIGEPTVSPAFALTSADSLIIVASDGLWDVMSGQEACDFVRDIADPEEAASALLTTAIGKGTQDNISVIVARL